MQKILLLLLALVFFNGEKDKFDFIATRDDVEHGKPDPEIYLLVAKQLNTPPAQCFVIEDSASGVKAAIAAGMWCIAVTTEYTREAVYDSKLLNPRWIVDEPANLVDVAKQMIAERGEIGDL